MSPGTGTQHQKQQHGRFQQRVAPARRRQLPTIKSLPLLTDPLTAISQHAGATAASTTPSPSASYSYYFSHASSNTSPNHGSSAYANTAARASASPRYSGGFDYTLNSPVTGNSAAYSSLTGKPILSVPSLRLTHSFGSSTELSTSLNAGTPPPAPAQTTHLGVGGRETRHPLSNSSYRLHDIHKQYSFDNADLSRHSPYAELDTVHTHGSTHSWRTRTPESALNHAHSVTASAWPGNMSPANKSPLQQRHSPQSSYLRRLPLPNSNYIWRY